jgi:hypothetical protein
VYSLYLLSPALCRIIWSRVMFPTCTKATQSPCPSHLRLSLLSGLQRDGPGWNIPRRFAHSQISDQLTTCMSIVIFFHTSIIFLWNTPQISCLLWVEKKWVPARKKSVLLISLYLFNYSSNFEMLKSLTQLCNWATQKYCQKQHIVYVLLLRRPQKMPTFSKI